MQKEYVENLCNTLYINLRSQYMTDSDQEKANLEWQYEQTLQQILSTDSNTSDACKNLLYAMYKEYVYYQWHVPDFAEEDIFIMNKLESIIKKFYGEWFLENHRLSQEHWIFSDGKYALCFTPHFIQTVY